MKVAMAGLTVIAAMSAGLYDAAPGQGHGLYNAQAAYGACQEDALRGVHYPINGDLSQLGSLESTPHAATNFATPQTVRMSKLLVEEWWKRGDSA